jgi:hypothetical protein
VTYDQSCFAVFFAIFIGLNPFGFGISSNEKYGFRVGNNVFSAFLSVYLASGLTIVLFLKTILLCMSASVYVNITFKACRSLQITKA